LARIRTLHYGFFENPDLIETHPLARLLFAGLWTIADREGRLEDRPKKIKIQVLPGDDADVDALLQQLAERGFILRYTAEDQRYIQVINFAKFQRPHCKEADSRIPPPLEMHRPRSVQAPTLEPASTDLDEGEPAWDHGSGIRDQVTGKRDLELESPPSSPSGEIGADAPMALSTKQAPSALCDGTPGRVDGSTLLSLTGRHAPTPPGHGRKVTRTRSPAYTVEFELFWAAYPGSGSKQAAFREWERAGLQQDSTLRSVAMAGLHREIAHRQAANEVGTWQPAWKNAERWLKSAGWEAKLTPISSPDTRLVPLNMSGTSGRRTVNEIGPAWLENRKENYQ
jgi:hypothetical protein